MLIALIQKGGKYFMKRRINNKLHQCYL